MNPACQICRGACCESIITSLPAGEDGRWLGYHGTALPDGRLELATPCGHLCSGSCAIHDVRPAPCRDYSVGSLDCRATVLRRRPAQATEIFEAMGSPNALSPN